MPGILKKQDSSKDPKSSPTKNIHFDVEEVSNKRPKLDAQQDIADHRPYAFTTVTRAPQEPTLEQYAHHLILFSSRSVVASNEQKSAAIKVSAEKLYTGYKELEQSIVEMQAVINKISSSTLNVYCWQTVLKNLASSEHLTLLGLSQESSQLFPENFISVRHNLHKTCDSSAVRDDLQNLAEAVSLIGSWSSNYRNDLNGVKYKS